METSSARIFGRSASARDGDALAPEDDMGIAMAALRPQGDPSRDRQGRRLPPAAWRKAAEARFGHSATPAPGGL
jgi:hypothetical protein